MSPAASLAAVAAILLVAAARELLAARSGSGRDILRLSRPSLDTALRLGIPGRLERAGLGARLPLASVLLAKLAGAAVGTLAAWAAAPAAPGRLAALVAVVLPVAGFLLPDALLEGEARRRRRRLLGELPDALDLLAVASAAGRSPASSFAEIARSGTSPLAEELRATVADLSCGTPLQAALASLRDRVSGSEVATLTATIERSRRLGSPLADQLRRQAASLRADQRRAVEEHAARAAPKIQLVVALVLVPSVLLMIAAGLFANADVLLAGF